MASRARALAAAAFPRGLSRLFSTSFFVPPPIKNEPSPKAEPNPNLFVSGLSKRTTTEGLREAFSKFGEIVQARVVTDRVSGFSKGFGFVMYDTVENAAEGIKGMDGKYLDGWVIFAEYARPRPPPPSFRENSQYGDSSYPASDYGNSSQYGVPQNADPSQLGNNPHHNSNPYISSAEGSQYNSPHPSQYSSSSPGNSYEGRQAQCNMNSQYISNGSFMGSSSSHSDNPMQSDPPSPPFGNSNAPHYTSPSYVGYPGHGGFPHPPTNGSQQQFTNQYGSSQYTANPGVEYSEGRPLHAADDLPEYHSSSAPYSDHSGDAASG